MNRWIIKPLGELCTVVAGGTPSRSRSDFYNGGIPWVKISDMLQGTINETEENISQLGLENSAAKILPPKTVLISIFATIGRTAVLGIQASTNQAIAGVIPNNSDEIMPVFLRYFLDSSVANLVAEARGVAQLNINGKILKSLPVPVPPLAEQQRIVKVLNEADALCKIRDQTDQRTAVLIPALFNEIFGDPETNPRGWPTITLGECCKFFGGSSLPVGTPFSGQPNGLLHLKVGDMNEAGNETFITRSREWSDSRKVTYSCAPVGTIVIPKRGGAIATNKKRLLLRPALLDPNLMGICAQPEKFHTEYLYEWFRLFDLTRITTGSAVPQLNKQDLAPLQIQLPPLALQKEFAAHVDEIRKLESAQATSRKRLDDLFQSLLHRAFAGEL